MFFKWKEKNTEQFEKLKKEALSKYFKDDCIYFSEISKPSSYEKKYYKYKKIFRIKI